MKKTGGRARRFDPVLAAVSLLAAFLYGYGIWNDSYANTYYTTAVGSMLQSFHNFFFASLDSAGSVTVDKPPVTFWIQTLFAWMFGLHGWSVILPQVLAGVGSVLLLYALIKPTFGRGAARLGALAMACTPVAAAVSRTNNIDAMLVFTLLLASWCMFRGTRTGRTGSLLAAFALVGIGFNMKMLQAYMVLPALYLLLLLAYRTGWKKKAAVLVGGTALLLGVSVSWALVVDSIPADQRPYVGSSTTNSVMELAFGYNGVSRLTGDRGGGAPGAGGGFPGGRTADGTAGVNAENAPNAGAGQMPAMDGARGVADGMQAGTGQMETGTNQMQAGTNQMQAGTDSAQAGGVPAAGSDGVSDGDGQNGAALRADGSDRSNRDGTFDGGPGDGGTARGGTRGGGGGGMFNTGDKGPLRLFQQALSGQASWLLPFALIGCIGLLYDLRRRNITRKHQETLFWLAWLIPVAGFFSVAGFFHEYYLIMLAPPVAALAGAGAVELWTLYRSRSSWLSWLLPAAVLAASAFAWYVIRPYNDTIGAGWSAAVAAGGAAVTVALVLLRSSRFSLLAAAAGMVVLLAGPVYWAATPIVYGGNSMIPKAGPGESRGGMGMGMAFPSAAAAPGAQGAPDSAAAPGQMAGGFSGDRAAGTVRGGNSGRNGSEGVDEKLLVFLREHQDTEYLFATTDYGTAGPYIIDEGERVVILNGFSGSDVVYTEETLRQLVEEGKVKYFLLSGGGMGGGRGGSSELTDWIRANGKEVPASVWQGTGSGTLYEVVL